VSRRHLIIPDTQVRPGVPTHHIDWAAAAIVEYLPDVIIHLGDHWDMPSLNRHENPGSIHLEGARIQEDIQVGNEALERLDVPVRQEIERRAKGHRKRWNPVRKILRGNHEQRVPKAVAEEPKLEGILSEDMFYTPAGWHVHPFLEIVEIDGIAYSHYFSMVHSGRAIGGSIDNRLNKIGQSFVQGHQQGLLYGLRQYPGNARRHGLVAGSFYLHDEHYRDVQSNGEWRGLVVLNEVADGSYDVMPLSMQYLARKYG